MGLPTVAEVMVLHDYFDEDFGVASGIAFTGGAIGMIIFPPLTEYLITLFGWKSAILLFGAVCFNVCVAGVFMKQPKNSAYKSLPQSDKSEEQNCKNGKLFKFKRTFVSYLGFSILSKEPILITYLASFCLWCIALSGWVIFLVSYTMSLGYPAQTGSFLSSIGGVGTLIGRLMSGPIENQKLLSGRMLFVILSFGSAGTLVLYPFVQSHLALVVVSFLVGVFLGTPTPVVIVMIKELMPASTEEFTGAVGLHFFALGIGLLAGAPLTGKSIGMLLFVSHYLFVEH